MHDSHNALSRLAVNQRAIAVLPTGERYLGTILQVNDPDQGDFEYYLDHDEGGGSFWPRENLIVKDDITDGNSQTPAQDDATNPINLLNYVTNRQPNPKPNPNHPDQ
jgi:hypothetical protein